VILETLSLLKNLILPVDVYTVFSAGEEFSGFGARHAAWEIAPEEAIVVDVTHGVSNGTPKEKAFPLGRFPRRKLLIVSSVLIIREYSFR
jgi:endoglucanase